MLSPAYLLQQLHGGGFLDIVAAGMMLVVQIGPIDLSVPWTLTATAMMATAVGGRLGVATGLAVELAVCLVNGLAGAYPRVRPMIFTLGVNAVMRGLMVAHPRGLRAADRGEDLMRLLGAERIMRARGGPVGRHACRLRPIGTGDAYLLPAIDAVVVGGTSILGGRGRYLSTLFGIISIVLVNSVLSIMQMSGASRQTIRHRHYRHAARLWPR